MTNWGFVFYLKQQQQQNQKETKQQQTKTKTEQIQKTCKGPILSYVVGGYYI